MSSPTGPVAPNEQTSSSSAVEHAAVQGPSGHASYDSKTQVSSMSALREKAPEVYEAMMKGIAMNIVRKMHRSQEHLKEMMRKARQDAS